MPSVFTVTIQTLKKSENLKKHLNWNIAGNLGIKKK